MSNVTIKQVESTGMNQAGRYKDSSAGTVWEASAPISLTDFKQLLGEAYSNWQFPYYLVGAHQLDEQHFAATIGQYYLD